jgi:hypothetical protein
MKHAFILIGAAMAMAGCASTDTLLANESGITIVVENKAFVRMEDDAAQQAQAHCEQYGKNAVLAGVDGATTRESGTYRFLCVAP